MALLLTKLLLASGGPASFLAAPTVRTDLRTDGVPVTLNPDIAAEFERMSANSVPFQRFSEEYVAHALATGVDWRTKGAVTPAKDQGSHGYCGTFGRTCAAEGQFAIHAGRGLRNFSEEQLVECIGWTKDQFGYFSEHGFMDMAIYPYVKAGYPDQNPPIPGHPCMYDKSKVIAGTDNMAFTNTTSPAHNDEAQLAAWIFKNGPVNSGVDAGIFGKRKKGCEEDNSCFITKEMCAQSTAGIDHSITIVGFGTDATDGDYWIIKNSWSTKFGNQGFIKMARGYTDAKHLTGGCAHIACCGWVPCWGDCPTSGLDVQWEGKEEPVVV
jgi:C1A family cysteine protease